MTVSAAHRFELLARHRYRGPMADPTEPVSASAELGRRLGITRPVLLAPMAKIAGGRLAAAVSAAGGMGFVGGGYGDRDWIAEQMHHCVGERVGIGLITWNMNDGAVTAALEHRPAAVWLSFGDPTPHIAEIHEAGAQAVCQVGTVAEAVAAVEAGADVIVAQGSEAGGHGRTNRTLFGLLPAISAACPDVPLVAAGGITNAAGLRAAQSLGAAGVALGTALYATTEANDVNEAKQRLVAATGDDTVHSVVYDLIRGPEWPAEYSGRSLRTTLTDEWAGREDELRPVVGPLVEDHVRATTEADMSVRVVWAGEGVDAIEVIEPAVDVVHRFPEIAR
jgi:nitronate monooxygenase